jgi:hypothetical protein
MVEPPTTLGALTGLGWGVVWPEPGSWLPGLFLGATQALLSLGCTFFGLGVLLPGLLKCIPVDAVMVGKTIVFTGNDRPFEVAGDLLVRHPLLAPR